MSDENKKLINERASRVRHVRKHFLELTQKALATELGVNNNTLTFWDGGFSGGLSQKGAKKICNYLKQRKIQCTEEWLMHGIGVGPGKAEKITDTETVIRNEIAFFCTQNKNGIGFKINDVAMTPFYKNGDYVAGIETKMDDCIDKDCIITFNDGSQLLRRVVDVKHNKEGMAVIIRSLNFKYSEENANLVSTTVRSVAPIIRQYQVNNDKITYPLSNY